MLRKQDSKNILRLIDANLNRCREGLRVCEDLLRFLLNDKTQAAFFKRTRHSIYTFIQDSNFNITELLLSRNTAGDVGKKTITTEYARSRWQDIFMANMERAKESLRVLEETAKLSDRVLSEKFKKLRFKVYDTEKKVIKKYKHLSDS